MCCISFEAVVSLAIFMHYTHAMYLASSADGSPGDGSNLDDIIASVKDLEITPERIREFLPKVNWDQLASLYLKGRSGAECETR